MRTNRVVVFTFLALLIISGCNRRVPIAALPPAPPASSPVPPPAAPSAATAALNEADGAFRGGSYDAAARGYDNYLRLDPKGNRRDEALFRMGLAYALRPTADWGRATSAFRQIMETFPNSPYKPPAALIVSLHSELDQVNENAQEREQRIRQVTTELDRLKKIDADRPKRP